jgi:hypothetical protein
VFALEQLLFLPQWTSSGLFFKFTADRVRRGKMPGLPIIGWGVNSGSLSEFVIPALRLAMEGFNDERPETRAASLQLSYVIASKSPSLVQRLGIKVGIKFEEIVWSPEQGLGDFGPKADTFKVMTRPA